MVEAIIRITVVAVVAVVLADLGRGAWLAVRLGRQVHRRYPHLGRELWLPLFRSSRDVRVWLATWRGVLTSGDPMIAAIRGDGRAIIGRHLQLMLASNAWAVALTALAPRLT